jgi:hypothetical protein
MKLQRWSRHNGDYVKTTNGPWVKASDVAELESEKQKLIELFKNCRDATGYSDEYFRGMYNGIEWARSCLEKDCPEYKDTVEKSGPIYLPTIAELWEMRE